MSNSLQNFVFLSVIAAVIAVMLGGCRAYVNEPIAGPPSIPAGQPLNPLPVPMLERELVMDEVSDAIDDYFPILTEERIRIVDGIMSEGWIETRPTIGGSVLEPWKRDSTRGFERLHATLQSVRRFAKVRVIPTENNYLVDLRVYKELEDLAAPVGSSISGQPVRIDNSLDVDRNEIVVAQSGGWIPLGRDLSVEREILKNIESRFFEAVRAIESSQPTIPGR